MPSSTKPTSREPAPLEYQVAMAAPHTHEYQVTMRVPALSGKSTVDLAFPAWAPGSYMVRDFARHIYDLRWQDERGRDLPCERLDKQTWRVTAGGRPFTVRYTVFAFEPTVRTSCLDDQHGYWNGTSLFFYVPGETERRHIVKVVAPRPWRVSTALPSAPGGRFVARSFDELADSPFEVGTHDELSFTVGRTRFEVAWHGRTNADAERVLDILKRVTQATGRIFGGFPFARYLFIIHALPSRGGGLEHANSCTLDIAGLAFEDERGYQGFAELAAHEFFHAWNVKRIHDRVLGPFDYGRENYTRLLWFHEGFTEYVESLILLRAGLINVDRYLDDLADAWGKYISRPGRNVTPLSELSFEAWIKLYKPADNHTNRTVSYYDKGRWAALVLELTMRRATHGRRGILDLFVRLWQRFGQPDRGLTARDIRVHAEAIAGRSLGEFFDRFIDGCDELPVPRLLRAAGIDVETRRAWDGEDDATKQRRARGWVGLACAGGGPSDRAVVRNVIPDSPAWKAGLTFGDDVIAVGAHRVNAATVARRLADAVPGATVDVTYFRQDILRRARVRVGVNPDKRWEFSLDHAAPAAVRAVRKGWLGQ